MHLVCPKWQLSAGSEGSKIKTELLQSQKRRGKNLRENLKEIMTKNRAERLSTGKTTFWLSRGLFLMFCQMQSLPLSALLQKNVEAGASLAYKWRRQTFLCSIICCKAPHLKVSRELRVLLLGSLSQLGSQLLKKEEKPKQAAALMVISGTFLLSTCHWGEV